MEERHQIKTTMCTWNQPTVEIILNLIRVIIVIFTIYLNLIRLTVRRGVDAGGV